MSDWLIIAIFALGIVVGWMWNDIMGGNRFYAAITGRSKG